MFLPAVDRVLKSRVATRKITGKDPRDPLQERGHRRHDIRLRESPHSLVRVRAHPPGPPDPPPGDQRDGPHREGVDDVA